ncbi:hypothetical protein HYU22_03105 [Candidatus Woesearchaeota archaeon]|nr:hypothetical protein [Candidatus Woesearchaeota archaeon]
MERINDILEERNWLLKEYGFLKEMRLILLERKKILPTLQRKEAVIALDKSTKRKIKRLLRKIGRTERRTEKYAGRLLQKIEKTRLNTDFNITFNVNGKETEAKTIKEHIQLYSDAIVKATSLYTGSLQGILTKKRYFGYGKKETKLDWDLLELEVKKVIIDVTALIALLESITYKSRINENKFRLELESFGFPTSRNPTFTTFLIQHWPDILKIKQEIGDKKEFFFRYCLPEMAELLEQNIISWNQIVTDLPKLTMDYGDNVEYLFFRIGNFLELLKGGVLTWNELIKGLSFIAIKYGDTAKSLFEYGFNTIIKDHLKKKKITWKQVIGGLPRMAIAARTESKTLFNDGFPAIKDIINEKTWDYLVELTEACGKDSGIIFSYHLPKYKELILKRPLALKEIVDIAKISKNVLVLFEDGIPLAYDLWKNDFITWDEAISGISKLMVMSTPSNIFKQIIGIKHLINRNTWPGIIEMIEAADPYAGEMLQKLPFINDLIDEKTWPIIVKMALETKEDGFVLFESALPSIKELILKNILGWDTIANDLPKIIVSAERDINPPLYAYGINLNTSFGYYPSRLFIPGFAVIQYLITKNIWGKIVRIIVQKKEDMLEFFQRWVNTVFLKEFKIEEQQFLFDKLLTYLLSSNSNMKNKFIILELYFEFIQMELRKGKSIDKINIIDFAQHMILLRKRNILGLFNQGDLVIIKSEKMRIVIPSLK